jgi:hypothetical protein
MPGIVARSDRQVKVNYLLQSEKGSLRMIDLRTLMMRRSTADWGIGDNVLTLTTRNPTTGHRCHCAVMVV